jgi:hypothetical protein
MVVLETLAELLMKKNSRSWIKYMIKLPLKENIFIEKVEYIKEAQPITCKKGFFYDTESGTNLGKSVTRCIYFIVNGVELEQPKLIPNIEWREE